MPVIGGSQYFDETITRGGQRRQSYHMARDQLALHHGEPPRGIQHMGETETVHHPMFGTYRAVGSGMGWRDQGVRRETLAMARNRAMAYPMVNPSMRGSAMEGSGWFSDLASKIGQTALQQISDPNSVLRQQVIPAVKPHLGKFGKAGELAQQGLSLAGMGKPPHKKRLTKEMLMEARMSGLPYLHGGAYYLGDKRLKQSQVRDHMLSGGGFWGDVWDGIKSGAKAVGNFIRPVVAPVGNALGSMVGLPMAGTFADQGLKLAGLGKGRRMMRGGDAGVPDRIGYGMSGGDAGVPDRIGYGKAKKAPSARNVIVKKVMAEKGLSMIEASKFVKQHGLY